MQANELFTQPNTILLDGGRGWKTEEINGIEFELNSILVEKWKGKAYRLFFYWSMFSALSAICAMS